PGAIFPVWRPMGQSGWRVSRLQKAPRSRPLEFVKNRTTFTAGHDGFAAHFPPLEQPGNFPGRRRQTMFNHILLTLLWSSTLIGLARGAQAADGPTLIDQRAAQAGKVTALDTPGFPVTISQSGSYRLTGNLNVPDAATTAIEITADNVTLDLNGFTISGPNVCTPNPTRCTYSGGAGIGVMAVGPPGVVSPANVRVMNRIVRGMRGHTIRMI